MITTRMPTLLEMMANPIGWRENLAITLLRPWRLDVNTNRQLGISKQIFRGLRLTNVLLVTRAKCTNKFEMVGEYLKFWFSEVIWGRGEECPPLRKALTSDNT